MITTNNGLTLELITDDNRLNNGLTLELITDDNILNNTINEIT